jgi:hypothetical protein
MIKIVVNNFRSSNVFHNLADAVLEVYMNKDAIEDESIRDAMMFKNMIKCAEQLDIALECAHITPLQSDDPEMTYAKLNDLRMVLGTTTLASPVVKNSIHTARHNRDLQPLVQLAYNVFHGVLDNEEAGIKAEVDKVKAKISSERDKIALDHLTVAWIHSALLLMFL